MSMYSLLNGIGTATLFFLPMLGKHPGEFSRFRDCFVLASDLPASENRICVYTRTGGNNRLDYADEIQAIQDMGWYERDEDDDFDNTYMTFYFLVPPHYWKDFDTLLGSGELCRASPAYQAQIDRIYPEMAGKLPWHGGDHE